MKDYCKTCQVPEIVLRINTSRIAAKAANANVVASETPTQAAPYIQQAEENIAALKQAMQELGTFARSGKKCQHCDF